MNVPPFGGGLARSGEDNTFPPTRAERPASTRLPGVSRRPRTSEPDGSAVGVRDLLGTAGRLGRLFRSLPALVRELLALLALTGAGTSTVDPVRTAAHGWARG
ncbi:hypothetical protein ABZ372_41635 [Streptomyces sp. NPDC005921]|uniref:hypothetical protein n=1 Tax=Streptomyces sp. NPDC005827 TaxID=3157070 RepID=UPI0033FD238C